MKRVLIGVVVAVIVIALAGFFGVNWYVQDRATREVEAAFDQIRGSGAKATHGSIAFDLRTRTLTVADIQIETASQPPVLVKIGSLVAAGVSQPDAGRISLSSLEASDAELDARAAPPSAFHIAYKAPKVVIKDYAGPSHGERPPASASSLDVYGFLLKQFAAISASSMTIPSVVGTVDLDAGGFSHGEFVYAGVAAEGIKDGMIARQKVGDISFKVEVKQASQTQTITGHLVDAATYDFDTAAMVAVLDPHSASDDRIRRAYRQGTTGSYEVSSSLGMQMHMDGFTIDDVGLRPSKLQLPAIMALMAQPATPSPAQLRDLTEKAADLYQGLNVGNFELRGISMTTPEGPLKMAAIRIDMQDGKANLAVEGVDGKSPQGPVKLGRFALKSFDMAGFMRSAGQFADPAQRPPATQALELLKALGGAELKDFAAPYKSSNKQIKIDTFSFNWGQFVGLIPTQLHLTAKMNSPLDASNPALLPLLTAGIDTAYVDADLGAGWTEGAGTFVLSPIKLDLGNVLNASASVSLAHVPREVFTVDPQAAMAQAMQIEAGPLELTLHDLGGVDILIAQFARMQTVSRDAARQAIIDTIKAMGDKLGEANPDVASAVEAISHFIETPGQTLTLKLTPRAKAPVMQLVQLLSTDPPSALAQFKIEASTGL
jgi:hypothetical protein